MPARAELKQMERFKGSERETVTPRDGMGIFDLRESGTPLDMNLVKNRPLHSKSPVKIAKGANTRRKLALRPVYKNQEVQYSAATATRLPFFDRAPLYREALV